MKTKILIYIILFGLLFTFSLGRCTSEFTDINTNKRALQEIDLLTVGNVFAFAEYSGLLYDWWYWQQAENLYSDLYTQYYSNKQPFFATDRHLINLDWVDAAWNKFYIDVSHNLAIVLEKTKVNGMVKQYAIAQIYKVLVYQRMTDYYGPIPYFSAANGELNVTFDDQESIYKDFFVQLDSATATLAKYAGENAFGANDQIYGGDVNKWITFANTLRLRVAMRISYTDPESAKIQAEKAVAAGVIEINEDNAILKTTPASINPLPQMLPWNEFRMSATMESILKGFEDPRLPAYWSPAVNTGEFTGMRNGLSEVEMSMVERSADNLSTMAPRWSIEANKEKTPWEVMLASEAWFLRAEGALKGWNMGTTAEDAYYKGIEMSLKYWGADDEQIAAYQAGTTTPVALPDFDTPPQSDIVVAWSADPSKHLEQIMTQKWIALFPDGWEAWSENRRTGFPRLYPIIHSDNADVPVDSLMRRIQYPTNEYGTNAAAVEDGISKLGGPDKASTRLWWNVAK